MAFAGDSSAKAKGTLTETSIPIESWQLAELTWGEPGENSAPQGQLITTGGDPQMILEDVSGRVVRTVSYNVEFDGDSREMCLYYTTKTGEPYSQDRRVFPKVLADGTYVYTLPRTQIVALRLDPCSPDENKTVGLTFTPQSITQHPARRGRLLYPRLVPAVRPDRVPRPCRRRIGLAVGRGQTACQKETITRQ